jgi:hypothetical protein
MWDASGLPRQLTVSGEYMQGEINGFRPDGTPIGALSRLSEVRRPGRFSADDFVPFAATGVGGTGVTGNATIDFGHTFQPTGVPGENRSVPTIWDQNGARLVQGTEGVDAFARGINLHGTYVGITLDFSLGTRGGFIGRDGSAMQLNFPGFPETRVYEINDSDEFVGVYEPVNNQIVRGYVATHNLDTGAQTIRDLGLFPGYNQTWVYANNNAGYIVGGAYTGIDFDRALIWLPGSDTPLDLNTMVDLPGVTLIDAYRINNAGQILAEARLDAGGFAYYRLDPIIPEPAAMGAMIALGLIARRRWRACYHAQAPHEREERRRRQNSWNPFLADATCRERGWRRYDGCSGLLHKAVPRHVCC